MVSIKKKITEVEQELLLYMKRNSLESIILSQYFVSENLSQQMVLKILGSLKYLKVLVIAYEKRQGIYFVCLKRNNSNRIIFQN